MEAASGRTPDTTQVGYSLLSVKPCHSLAMPCKGVANERFPAGNQMSNKGKWCPYKAALFCQEGYCSNCEIYLSRGKKKPSAGGKK